MTLGWVVDSKKDATLGSRGNKSSAAIHSPSYHHYRRHPNGFIIMIMIIPHL
jgi:hypothetical protein